jgi:hypothetical protein
LLLTTSIACAIGLAGLYVRLRRDHSISTTLAAVVLLAGGTPLTWYTLFEPAVTEAAAFALTAWIAVAAALPLADRKSRAIRILAWSGVAAVPVLTVWWTTPAGSGPDLARVGWSHVLFSPRQGFLAWSPVAYLAVVGTLVSVRRTPVLTVLAIVLLLATAAMTGASGMWLREPAFGARPMIVLLAILAPGLAHLIDAVRSRPMIALAPLVALPILWNHLLMVQYTAGMLPKDEPVSFAQVVRQQADVQSRTLPFYPFAFPANVWFAWREDVPVGRYDLLAMEPRAASIDLALDRTVERFLLEGWSGPTALEDEQGWWIGERRATIVVPLSPSAEGMRVVVVARSRFEEPTFEADLTLLVNDYTAGDFSPPAAHASEAAFTVPRSALRDGLNKLTFVSRGAHPIDPADTRPPGPVARRASRSGWPVAVYRVAIKPL